MLVLSRGVGKQIRVGHGVVLTVLGVRGNKLRLGVQAPANIPIDREEVRTRKANEPDRSSIA